MSTLSDQLLKAGLVTQEQVEKAAEKPKRNKQKRNRPTNNKRNHSSANKAKNTPTNNNKKSNNKKEPTDLEKFYQERAKIENKEKQEAIRAKKEAARIKKEINTKINSLISANLLNDDTAEIRFNFVIGTTIKYLFVTEKQQQQLMDGQLAITFLGGKRSLIPIDIAQKILKLNPNKIVVLPAESQQ